MQFQIQCRTTIWSINLTMNISNDCGMCAVGTGDDSQIWSVDRSQSLDSIAAMALRHEGKKTKMGASLKPTKIPSFDPSVPPPERRGCVREQAAPQRPGLAERERTRPRLRPPETFPRSAKQIREDRKSKA